MVDPFAAVSSLAVARVSSCKRRELLVRTSRTFVIIVTLVMSWSSRHTSTNEDIRVVVRG